MVEVIASSPQEFVAAPKTSKKYFSLIDRIPLEEIKKCESTPRTIQQIFKGLQTAMHNKEKLNPLLLVGPEQIINTILHEKCVNGHSKESTAQLNNLLEEAVSVALSVFNQKDVRIELERLQLHLNQYNQGDLFKRTVSQRLSTDKSVAFTGHRSEQAAKKIIEETGGEDIMFMALSPGSTGLAIDVYLRYLDMARQRRKGLSSFYHIILLFTLPGLLIVVHKECLSSDCLTQILRS